MRKTKLVCTLGPATDDENMLEKIAAAGMDVARLNFSHGTHEEHKKRIDAVKRIRDKTGQNIAVMLDTKGPEIRIKQFAEGSVSLNEGERFTLNCEGNEPGDKTGICITYDISGKVAVGDIILADDGLISMCVVGVEGKKVLTEIKNGGVLSNNKSLNIPGVEIPMPALTQKDNEDIIFGIENDIDFISASFIRSASDVLAIRSFLEKNDGDDIKIIAKIENRQGIDNIDEIIRFSDGVMVARGDLGVEIPAEEVPMVQKRCIKKCNEAGKPVITATQMLDSMMRSPRPTRAEVADVANAVLDGSDAVMLSGETAAGKYPLEAVSIMAKTAQKAEEGYARIVDRFYGEETVTNMISHASCQAANKLGAKAIITPTASGYTPRMVAKYRPSATIIALPEKEKVRRQLALTRGVLPLMLEERRDFENVISDGIVLSMKEGYINEGDLVVITGGLPFRQGATTNTVRIETAGRYVLRGVALGNAKARGRLVVYEKGKRIPRGSIIYTDFIDDNLKKQTGNLVGLLTSVKGITSECAQFALEHHITALTSVCDETLPEGMIEIDPLRKMAYKVYVELV